MSLISTVSEVVAFCVGYLLLGFVFALAAGVVWYGAWKTRTQRIFAASFFPLTYFLEHSKKRGELSYAVFDPWGKRVYFAIYTLTWVRVIITTCLAPLLWFCIGFTKHLAAVHEPTSTEDD